MNPCSPSGSEQLVSASGDGQFVIWDVLGGVEVQRGAGNGRGLACVSWHGPYILTGDNDRLLKVYSAESCELVRTFEGHADLVRSIAVDPSMRIVISGSYDQTVRIWDFASGDLLRKVQGDLTSLVFGVAAARGRVVR